MKHLQDKQRGSISGGVVAIVLLALGLAMLAGLSIWLFMQYSEQKKNVDLKIAAAVAKAEKDTLTKAQDEFDERYKDPFTEFEGPGDYGSLTFRFPKIWSVYEEADGEDGGDYMAYLNPVKVPPLKGEDSRFALRVLIEDSDYDEVIKSYDTEIKKGDLKSRTFSANGQRGTRLDGNFSKDIRGAVVIFKIRDKTLSIFTDADTFKSDFEKVIKTIEFSI